MSLLDVMYLDSLAALRDHADHWDDLWRRSDVSQPTARAALIVQWLDCFRFGRHFSAVVLTDGSRFVAALPLVRKLKAKLVPTHDIPGNEWSPAGQLLLDSNLKPVPLCNRLITALAACGIRFGWFGSLPLDDLKWRELAAAARRAEWLIDSRPHCTVPQLELDGDWKSLQTRWSKNFRRQLEHAIRHLRTLGKLEFECLRPTNSAHALKLLDACLQLEQQGWKGAAGTAVMAHGPAHELLEMQTRQLAQWHQVQFALLRHSGRLIAFDYGWLAKSVYHSFKIGYAPVYAKQSPGQVLTMLLLEQLVADNDCRKVDFLGPLTPSLARWRPSVYTKGRLVVAYPDFVARGALFARRCVRGFQARNGSQDQH